MEGHISEKHEKYKLKVYEEEQYELKREHTLDKEINCSDAPFLDCFELTTMLSGRWINNIFDKQNSIDSSNSIIGFMVKRLTLTELSSLLNEYLYKQFSKLIVSRTDSGKVG